MITNNFFVFYVKILYVFIGSTIDNPVRIFKDTFLSNNATEQNGLQANVNSIPHYSFYTGYSVVIFVYYSYLYITFTIKLRKYNMSLSVYLITVSFLKSFI